MNTSWTGDNLLNLVLRFPTKRTEGKFGRLGHSGWGSGVQTAGWRYPTGLDRRKSVRGLLRNDVVH